ncbi:hypothetical protein MMC25_003426 [Agyrium rufum]|nr:hypothetical protein [Agyrium rufum]
MDPSHDSSIARPNGSPLTNDKGWDGKLRVNRQVVLSNPEALSDPEYSDSDDVLPGEQIGADEDLLDDYDTEAEDIDLVHCRITSIPALKLEKFCKVEKLCLRQNEISHIEFPNNIAETLQDLDLYDNLIGHIKGLDGFHGLTSLDLSFNKIKHIKNVSHLTNLTDLYFVQNRIQHIENLDGLKNLRNLELAANRIKEIDNLSSLIALEELWLGKNKITSIATLPHFPVLKILSLPSNRLNNLPSSLPLPLLEELYISHNVITALPPFDSLPKLRVLDISSNQISKLENLGSFQELEEFWASSNLLDSFEDLEKELGNKKNLETVYLEGNPLMKTAGVSYRTKVKLALPQVKQIDASECPPLAP